MVRLEKYSFGIGDRFAHQAEAQLLAFQMLSSLGIDVVPVWNKSNREHGFVGSEPSSVREAALCAVQKLNWSKPWHVDADHIRLDTVERFLPCSDFFTIDVADSIGGPISELDVADFIRSHAELTGKIEIPGCQSEIELSPEYLDNVVRKYLPACKAAGDIYRTITKNKGENNFIAEVSMDETETPQSPADLLVILAALADEKIRLQTIAPKFTGRFNKGVDYVGDLKQFAQEFSDDIAVLHEAVTRYSLPSNLKLSVHSGSDKFSLYPIIQEALRRTGAGVHVKTAGTTWLEELIGLAEAGGDGLALTQEIYAYAYGHIDELCAPYASVIDIHRSALPTPSTLNGWQGADLAAAIRHVQGDMRFNPHLRQLLHVSFKIAAKAGKRYLNLLDENKAIVGKQVTTNLFERHLKPLFVSA